MVAKPYKNALISTMARKSGMDSATLIIFCNTLHLILQLVLTFCKLFSWSSSSLSFPSSIYLHLSVFLNLFILSSAISLFLFPKAILLCLSFSQFVFIFPSAIFIYLSRFLSLFCWFSSIYRFQLTISFKFK